MRSVQDSKFYDQKVEEMLIWLFGKSLPTIAMVSLERELLSYLKGAGLAQTRIIEDKEIAELTKAGRERSQELFDQYAANEIINE